MLKKTTTLTSIALATALVSIFSQLSIPMPSGIPLTLQTFIIAFIGYLFTPKKAVASISLYILLGAVGVPVFANLKGGMQALVGATGGFIFGFLFLALFCSIGNQVQKYFLPIIIGTLGLLLCHALGSIQYSIVTQNPLIASVLTISIPYLVKDFLCVAVAHYIARILSRSLLKAGISY
ncbi:MAG: biotin transporter BioY [Lachnospiraceae bacterium]